MLSSIHEPPLITSPIEKHEEDCRLTNDDVKEDGPQALLSYATAILTTTNHSRPYQEGGTSKDGSNAEDKLHSVLVLVTNKDGAHPSIQYIFR